MGLGTYFSYCAKSSGAGVHVFRYRYVRLADETRPRSPYPVCLIFTSSQLYFEFTADLQFEGCLNNVHLQSNIVSVPLSTYMVRNRDPLSVFISEGMHQSFYLDQECAQYPALKSCIHKDDSQRHFDIFLDTPRESSTTRLKKPDAAREVIPLPSTLFCDFLYDLFYSSVFDEQAGVDTIRERLAEHFLCGALLSKLEYQYHREQLKKQVNAKEKHLKNIPFIYIENYLAIRRKRIAYLNNEHAYYLFEVKTCFDSSVREMNKIAKTSVLPYSKELRSVCGHNYESLVSEPDCHMTSFFIARMAMLEAGLLLYRTNALLTIVLTLLGFIVGFFWLAYIYQLSNGWHISILMLAAMGLFYSIVLPVIFCVRHVFLWLIDHMKVSPYAWAPVFFPFMTLGIVTAWVSYVPLSGDAMSVARVSPVIQGQYWWLVGINTVVIISISYLNIKWKVPEYRNYKYSILNSVWVCLAGISFSIFFGFASMHFNSRKTLLEKEQRGYMPSGFYGSVEESIKMYDSAEAYRNDFERSIFWLPDSVRISAMKVQEKDSLQAFLQKLPNCVAARQVLAELKRNHTVGYYKKSWSRLYDKFLEQFYFDKVEKPAVDVTKYLSQRPGPQYVAHVNLGFSHWFFYPRLLLLYSFIAFYIGFLLQFLLNFSNRYLFKS